MQASACEHSPAVAFGRALIRVLQGVTVKHTMYHVELWKEGSKITDTLRRYSEFDALRKQSAPLPVAPPPRPQLERCSDDGFCVAGCRRSCR